MNKLQKITLEKYHSKISYALSQPSKGKPDLQKMREEIGHAWSEKDCLYCRQYRRMMHCSICPLETEKGCCKNLFNKMNDAKTWKIWIKYARKILKYVERYG